MLQDEGGLRGALGAGVLRMGVNSSGMHGGMFLWVGKGHNGFTTEYGHGDHREKRFGLI